MFKKTTRSTAQALLIPAILLFAGCGGVATSSNKSSPSSPGSPSSPSGAVTVSVSPTTANIHAGDTFLFTATISGSSNTSVTWAVNGSSGGSSTLGTISLIGNYTAPAVLPSPNTVTVSATSAVSSSASGSSAVTLMNPTPVVSGINPASIGSGSFNIAVNGNKFVSGAQVLLGSTPLTTTFVSSTQLTASGSASAAGNFAITVQNPAPGSNISNVVDLQVNGSQQASACSQMSVGQNTSLNGFLPFPANSPWNTDISSSPVDPNSATIINAIGTTVGLHPDFGSGEYQGSNIGIPYTVVGAGQALLNVDLTSYASESDPGPMPIPLAAPIEGYPNPGSGDRHVLVLDNQNCFLYELYSSYPQTNSWNAGSTAIWDLLSAEQRPYTWTSADAAGLPIFPGLVRYDEVAAGQIAHAIRFTLQDSEAAFVPPATHFAGSSSSSLVPMGMRMRLKGSFDVSGYSASNQVMLNAMKTYGLIMADNGSNMYITGAPDGRWNNDDLHNLGGVQAQDFDVIQMTPLYTQSPNNVPTGPVPNITSFTASSTSVASGIAVTLSWQVTGAQYNIVSPQVGAVRGSSVSVTPTQTTIYTLYSTNAFGRNTATVTVTVD